MKHNLFHDFLRDGDSIVYKQNKHRIMLKYQSNIVSKPAPGMQGCTMTKNKHLTSLKAVRLISLLHCRIYVLPE